MGRLREAGTELVSNVYVAAQAREYERRQEAGGAKNSRIEQLQVEADESLEKFEAIRRRWLSSQSREIPQDLRDALNDQVSQFQQILRTLVDFMFQLNYDAHAFQLKVKACDQLLSGKNSLLDNLHTELKSSEDEYVKTLKKQYDDLEIVAQRSEEQYKTMDGAYRDEIKQIIVALDAQFDERVFDWRRQAGELSEKEEKFLEDRLTLREEQQATIDELRDAGQICHEK